MNSAMTMNASDAALPAGALSIVVVLGLLLALLGLIRARCGPAA